MAGPIRISVLANASQAKRELQATATTAEKVGGGFKRMALPAAAAIGVMAKVGADALKAVANVERINAQTQSVIKSTGGAAGVTAGHVEGLANRLEGLTATEAEATQEGANLLLTFTNIQNKAGKGNQIFDRTTASMVDLARAMGTEPKAAAIQLGKALNDPIKGVGALSRVGVSFTEQQKKTIKSLVETGDTMGAQKIILGELEKQFGGSGKAFAQTAQGQLEQAKNAFGNLTESLVAGLLPSLLNLAQTGTKAFTWASQNQGTVKALVLGIAGLSAAVLAVNGVMAVSGAVMATYRGVLTVVSATTKAYAAVQWLLNAAMTANPLGLVVVAIVALVAVLVVAWKKSETFRSVVIGAWNGIKAAAVAVFGFLQSFITAVWGAIRTVITTYVRVYVAVVRAAWNAIKAATSAAWNGVKAVVGAAISFVASIIRSQVNIARSAMSAAWNAVRAGTSAAWNGIKAVVRAGVTGVIDLVRGVRDRITGVFAAAGGWLADAGRRIVQGLIDGITGMIDRVRSKLSELTNLIPNWKGPAERDARLLRPAGELIIGGLIDGFDRKTPMVKRTLQELSRDLSTFSATPTVALALNASRPTAQAASARADSVHPSRQLEVKISIDQADPAVFGPLVMAQIRHWANTELAQVLGV